VPEARLQQRGGVGAGVVKAMRNLGAIIAGRFAKLKRSRNKFSLCRHRLVQRQERRILRQRDA